MTHLFTLGNATAAYDDIASVERPNADVSRPYQTFRVILKGGQVIESDQVLPQDFQDRYDAFIAQWTAYKQSSAAQALLPTLRVKKLRPDAILPKRASLHASCFDVCTPDAGVIAPGTRALVKLGLSMAIPPGYEIQVRSRSGHAAKAGVFVLNSPGTVDADYRGEVAVILHNLGTQPFTYAVGDRVAQIAVCPVVMCEAVEVSTLDDTARGAGGFGSTGVGQHR